MFFNNFVNVLFFLFTSFFPHIHIRDCPLLRFRLIVRPALARIIGQGKEGK